MIRLRAAFTSRKLYWTVAADFNVIGACTSPWSSGEAPKKGPRFVYKRGSDFFGKQGEQVANALVNKGVTLGARPHEGQALAAPLVRGAGIDARTTQGPAHRGASPQCADGGPNPPADAHSNAYYAAEVQSVLRPEIARTSSVNLVGITTGSPAPDIEFLAANSPLIERGAISLSFFGYKRCI
jgi:hypothetical protein